MFNRLPPGRLIYLIMTEQEIKQIAEEYSSEYIPMYQKVVKIAFIDGMQKAFEHMKEKLAVL
jgi:hypothetical protein